MKNVLLLSAVLALAGGCKKKNQENATPPAGSGAGSGSAGSGSDMGSGSAAAAPAVDDKLVQRGQYLVKAAACLTCHTAMGPTGPDLANMGGGGLEMPDKVGTWRTPNITPDKGTGIGSWTDDQIIAAIREGRRPDGTQLYPIMPYMNFNVLTDDDAKAIVAFLHTLKPVERQIAKFELKMPKIPAPHPANQAPGDDPIKKGGYLASIMLCNHCHWTPNKEGTAPVDMDHMFSGGFPMELPPMGKGTLFSKNITSDPETGIGKWTEDQIFTAIKTMQRPDGKMIQGPMLLLQMGWSQLQDDDLHNVAKFIKSLPPIKNKVPASTFVPNAGPPPGGGAPPMNGSAAPAGSASGSGAASGQEGQLGNHGMGPGPGAQKCAEPTPPSPELCKDKKGTKPTPKKDAGGCVTGYECK